MCYHISVTKKHRKSLEERFDAMFDTPESYEPYFHFNGWESKNLYIVKQEDPETIVTAKWGVLPAAHDISKRSDFLKKRNTLNATRERLFESPLFSQLIGWQRCLVIADGLFEPHKNQDIKGSIPYYFSLQERALFAFAGLFSEHRSEAGLQTAASIITTEANDLFKRIHNTPNTLGSYRMPLVLNKEDEYEWLACRNNGSTIAKILDTAPQQQFHAYPVSQDIFKRKDSNHDGILARVSYP